MSIDMRHIDRSDNQQTVAYNVRALVRCEATYLGAALPTKTTQPPEIIHEPLRKICEKENLPTLINTPKKPVRMYIFHSGIVIEILFGKHNGTLVWYPIQNLYCSAGLQPLKTKHGPIEFRTLEDHASAKSSLKPIFAIVFRESVQKKVLQCHAFAVGRKELAQLLVQATAVAYRDKNGWKRPLNNVLFGAAEFSYTLNITDEVQPDSGYSDHEESSQKSEQSPQSSELSTDAVAQSSDNHNRESIAMAADKLLPVNTPVSMSDDSALSSPGGYRTAIQTSPSSSGTSVTFSRVQSDAQSGDEGHSSVLSVNSTRSMRSVNSTPSVRSVNSPSMSSGYPLSRDSSAATAHQINPQVVVIQKVYSPKNGNSTPYINGDKFRNINDRTGSMPIESFNSLSIGVPNSDNIARSDQKLKKPKSTSSARFVSSGGVPRQFGYSEPHYSSSLSGGSFLSRSSQYSDEPIYVQYHPEQFMYEGDSYLTNGVYADPKLSQSYKERHKSTKEHKKKPTKTIKVPSSGNPKGFSGHATRKIEDTRHLSMEGRLTKKSIPRQLL